MPSFFSADQLPPIPIMDALRQRKQGYNDLPIDTTDPRHDEPLVAIADYGIAGQAYYSRPNATTGQPVAGVPTDLYVRRSIAETLAKISQGLEQPEWVDFFGGEVELYLDDALRLVSLQKQLHDELIPASLRRNHPGISDEAVAKRLKDIIAVPSDDPTRPSPHATGGAIDITLRYKQSDRGYVADTKVPMGHEGGDTSERITPDYFEKNQPETPEDRAEQRNRRAYYAIMTGQAFGFDTGLINNPTEWWHWGRGDQLSEKVRGSAAAYYSIPKHHAWPKAASEQQSEP